jgi:hypothetical protein
MGCGLRALSGNASRTFELGPESAESRYPQADFGTNFTSRSPKSTDSIQCAADNFLLARETEAAGAAEVRFTSDGIE